MANKKSFRDNPAMQFISVPENGGADAADIQSVDQPSAGESSAAKPARSYGLNRPTPEAKSRRVQVLLRPGLYRQIAEIAAAEGKSVNDTIHGLLEKGVSETE